MVPAGEAARPADSFTELNARRLGPVRQYFRGHPRMMDLVVSAAFLLVALPNPALDAAMSGRWTNLLPVAVAAAALFFRRDHPVAVLALIALLEPVSTYLSAGVASVGVAVWFALYAVAVSQPLRTTLVAAGGALVPAIGALFLVPEDLLRGTPGLVWLLSGFVVLWFAVAVGVGVTVQRDRVHESELRNWAARNAELASAGERNRIAREMHDVVAHSLTVMVALSDGAAVVMKRDPDRAAEVLAELSGTGRTAIADMRRVLGVLRDEGSAAPLQPLPASSSLAQLLEGFRAAGLPLRVVVSGPSLPADPAFQLTLYRIVQESLTNVLRYAKSVTAVDVSIVRTGDVVTIRVLDDGRGSMGPVVSLGSGRGIAGMRERAAIYSGTVKCGTLSSGGWVVDVQLVVPESGNQSGEKDNAAGIHTGAPRGRPTAATHGIPPDS